MIVIDGSIYEGGGQIIRTALALSVLTRQPFRSVKIRFNRPKPGLKNQHIACIQALLKLTNGKANDAVKGSENLEFFPGQIIPRTLSEDIGTAGSITLMLQSLLLPCMFAEGKVRLKIKGGTDTKWSIPLDYFIHVILPWFADYADIKIQDIRRGFYPKGDGLLDLVIRPCLAIEENESPQNFLNRLKNMKKPLVLTSPPDILGIKGISCASADLKKQEVAKRQIRGAVRKISDARMSSIDLIKGSVKIQEQYHETASPGTVMTVWANPATGKVSMGGDCLGERGLRAEIVGENAAQQLLDVIDTGAALDTHLADNLIPLLALVGGKLKPPEITDHILSNIYVCEQFLDVRFHINDHEKIIAIKQ